MTHLGSKSGSFDPSRHAGIDVDLFEAQRMGLHLSRGEDRAYFEGDVARLTLALRFGGVGSDEGGRVFILVSADGCPGSGWLSRVVRTMLDAGGDTERRLGGWDSRGLRPWLL